MIIRLIPAKPPTKTIFIPLAEEVVIGSESICIFDREGFIKERFNRRDIQEMEIHNINLKEEKRDDKY